MIDEFKILTENKKPIETVYEIKGDEYKVPSFEEFMKDYQADENLNYSDLSGGSVGEVGGYGPCKVCDKFPEPRWVEMEMTCPAAGCTASQRGSDDIIQDVEVMQ